MSEVRHEERIQQLLAENKQRPYGNRKKHYLRKVNVCSLESEHAV
jgi:hypothetical protein